MLDSLKSDVDVSRLPRQEISTTSVKEVPISQYHAASFNCQLKAEYLDLA